MAFCFPVKYSFTFNFRVETFEFFDGVSFLILLPVMRRFVDVVQYDLNGAPGRYPRAYQVEIF